MRNGSNEWKVAGTRGMAALLAVIMVLHLSPARAEVGDIFSAPAPMISLAKSYRDPRARADDDRGERPSEVRRWNLG